MEVPSKAKQIQPEASKAEISNTNTPAIERLVEKGTKADDISYALDVPKEEIYKQILDKTGLVNVKYLNLETGM